MNQLKHPPLLLLILSIALSGCFNRTPSQERFSEALGIEIPTNAEVIKDEYQDMGQDYAINYTIKLSDSQMQALTLSIKKSRYYNAHVFIEKHVEEEMYIEYENNKAVWAKTPSGYMFQNKLGKHAFRADIDTIKHLALFCESSD